MNEQAGFGPSGVTRRAGVALMVVVAGVWLAGAGCARHMARHHAFTDDRDVIQMVSTNVQGKNVYIPSTVVVPAGKPVTLSIFNTTDTPHGFWIRGLGIQTILMNGEETKVELPALEGHKIYKIECQLHPPHRHATLVVLGN